MSGDVIIGLDAGTSMIKAVAFDRLGRELAEASLPNSYHEPGGGAVEQDMARTWTDTAKVLRMVAEQVAGRGRIAALGVTGQGDGTWMIDEAGLPVLPGWLWLDSRAAGIVEEMERDGVRRRIFPYTGCGLNACNQSAQLLWLRERAPELLERASTAFHCKDWLYFKLTGERATDSAEGTFTFGDFRTRRYAPEVVEALGLSDLRRLLPPMLDGTTTTHPLSDRAAHETGLPAGTPVALGFLDVICTALGSGLYAPGESAGCSILGSTGMHMRFVPDARSVELPEEPGGYTMAFPVPGSAAQMQSNMAATLNIDWIVDRAVEAARLLGGPETTRKDALLALDARVLEGRPGAALYHPYIYEAGERGPFVDVAARAMVTGLSTRVGFLDLVRAVYEGLAFAARDCYLAMGRIPDEIRIAGGAARSRALRQLLAAVLDRPVRETRRAEAGAAGVAMIAAVATGLFADMDEAVAAWVQPLLGEPTPPDRELAGLYDRLFPVYLETRRAMPPSWRSLAAARAGDNP